MKREREKKRKMFGDPILTHEVLTSIAKIERNAKSSEF